MLYLSLPLKEKDFNLSVCVLFTWKSYKFVLVFAPSTSLPERCGPRRPAVGSRHFADVDEVGSALQLRQPAVHREQTVLFCMLARDGPQVFKGGRFRRPGHARSREHVRHEAFDLLVAAEAGLLQKQASDRSCSTNRTAIRGPADRR